MMVLYTPYMRTLFCFSSPSSSVTSPNFGRVHRMPSRDSAYASQNPLYRMMYHIRKSSRSSTYTTVL